MAWRQFYVIKSYVGSSLWVMPFLALLAQQVILRVAILIDRNFDITPRWPLADAGTASALQAVTTLSLSFLVFAFGSILVAIQVASGQLTPRIIATMLLRDNVIRITVGLFVFTLLSAISAASRIGSAPGSLVIWIAALSGFLSIAAFLYLIDYCARLLRPVSIVWRIGEQGSRVIETLYPHVLVGEDLAAARPLLGPAAYNVHHKGTSAILIAVALERLFQTAHRMGAVVEIVPRIGDFVSAGDPLLRIFGAKTGVHEESLSGLVAFGPERTVEQDPTFALRIIVDIAIKALSPAINDPTTAVLAIDQLQRLLGAAGRRRLLEEGVHEPDGTLRLIFRTPNWEDFVELAVREIRQYGASSFQVSRRLHAMLLALLESLPDCRKPALELELDLLEREVASSYALPEDRALARRPDTQGLGGASAEETSRN